MQINSYNKQQFIEFALKNEALLFGEFTLKSGRISPYFFNAGKFDTGNKIHELGRFYAATVQQAQLEFDLIFGPAYKGVPLATTVAIALAEHYGMDKPFCFNRKEKKTHGEGGSIVGAPLAGRVLIVDDVISAGLTIGESIVLIREAGAEVAGIVILLDRQERGSQTLISAVEEVKQNYAVPVLCVATMADILEYLRKNNRLDHLRMMDEYKAQYGAQSERFTDANIR